MKLITTQPMNLDTHPELSMFTESNEGHLVHFYEPEPGLFVAETPNVIERAIDAGYVPETILCENKYADSEIVKRYMDSDVTIYMCSHEELKDITSYKMTKGVLFAFRRRRERSVTDVLATASRLVILEDVENPTNVGSIFRSAAALNVDAVILTKGCSDPLYRRASRVAMGTVFQVPWAFMDRRISWPSEGIDLLKQHGFVTVSMALTDNSIRPDNPVLKNADKLAVIMGTEGTGLLAETISSSDHTVMIPMSHGVDSLNVAAASAVAFWEMFAKGDK